MQIYIHILDVQCTYKIFKQNSAKLRSFAYLVCVCSQYDVYGRVILRR